VLAAATVVAGFSSATSAQDAPPFAAPTPEPVAQAEPTAVEDDPFAVDAEAPAAPEPQGVPAGEAGELTYDAAADTVDIRVTDADLPDLLRLLAEQSRRNIIVSPGVTGVVSCSLYDVTVRQALDAVVRANDLAVKAEGEGDRFLYVYTRQELAEMEEAERRPETRVMRVYHLSPQMAAAMITPALSDGASVSLSEPANEGIASSPTDAGGYGYSAGDVLVVRDYPENLDEAERLLEKVDARPQQVLIEATILSTTLTEDNQLGVDFNLVGGVDLTQVNFLAGTGIPGSASVPAGAGGDVTAGGTGSNFSGPIGGGLKFGLVTGDVGLFLAALEGVTDTSVLANPKVLAVNKQKGEVLVGRQDGYLTTTLTETAATQEVKFLETGTRLVFRPFISRDGYVRLEVHPEDSAGGVNDSGLPSKVTTEVTSNVMVKDGHTIVIGGLFRESDTVAKSQVPVLGNIPILGRAFGRQSDSTVREEIIILLTPHVIKDDETYSKVSEQEKARAEKLRVGTRRGMMFWGRQRQAQANYRKAVEALALPKANRRAARFYVNAALQLDPSFIEAIELREKLRGEALAEADGSSVRSFVERMIAQDVAALPVEQEQSTPMPTTLPATRPEVGQ
jgi:type IV pilus assembly protein PilQ